MGRNWKHAQQISAESGAVKKIWYFLFDACEADLLLNYHSIYNPEYSRETWIDNIAYPHILH